VALTVELFWARLTNSETIRSRLVIWQTTLHLWRDYPWFGVGPGEFFWRYPAYLAQSTSEPNLYHPHNLWLEFGAIWGMAGLFWGLVFVGYVGRQLFARQRAQPCAQQWIILGLLAGLFAGLAHAQVDAFAALADLAGWHWLALGLLMQVKKSNSQV
jgi:O-antigen ligase